MVDVVQSTLFKALRQFRHFALFFTRHSQAEHGVDFVILNMQQRARTAQFCEQAHARHAKEGRHDADNAIRLPATLSNQREERAKRKAA
ncbi:hypothetical protein D3C75_1017900 [compost metagenome]